MKTRIIRALLTAIVAGLLAVAGTAGYGQPGVWNNTTSAIGGGA